MSEPRGITPAPDASRVAELMSAARSASDLAYCPYSRFPVGAAVLTANGEIFAAPNIENASYSVTLCAERNAAAQAVARGFRDLVALAVYTPTAQMTTPCGTCRQFLAEFNPRMQVICFSDGDDVGHFSLDELLPVSFGPAHLDP